MEEFVNSFDYNYPTGQGDSEAFTVHAEAGPSPFGDDTVLLKVGVRGKVVGRDQAKPAHLTFVIDTSGSMDRDDRLPLVRQSLAMVLDQLSPEDRVTVVSYGTQARLLAESVPGEQKQQILETIDALQTGGSTNLLAGIALGYEASQRHFISGGVNRVILCSDGVANVGPSEADELIERAGSLRKQGVMFTSVGFGAGNYDDRILEQLANKGDGGYLFVGSADEAERVFVDDLAATRPTIAFDAKIQVDFDPARVRRYRLIGYENRDIADADFRNDAVDAGEVGSGQSATALYELELEGPAVSTGAEPDIGTVYVRYRDADTGRVREIDARLGNDQIAKRSPSSDARFHLAASAARFAELLRGSEHVTEPDTDRELQRVQSVLEAVAGEFPLDRSVQELLELVTRARGLPRAE
jgi:Ca-activated chloride channel family protein